MAVERQRYALQTIFSFFLGLMIVAFIGVGVNTFYPSPTTQNELRIQQLQRQLDDINATRGKDNALNAADQARLTQVTTELRALQDKVDADMKPWARNTSIVVILFATMVMALSLVRSDQLKVISNGLLLGGLFTMLYGTGWVIFSGESTARFVVMVFALAVTVGLGYAKFVSGRKSGPAVYAPVPAGTQAAVVPTAVVGELESRVAALEARAAAAAAALGGGSESHSEE